MPPAAPGWQGAVCPRWPCCAGGAGLGGPVWQRGWPSTTLRARLRQFLWSGPRLPPVETGPPETSCVCAGAVPSCDQVTARGPSQWAWGPPVASRLAVGVRIICGDSQVPSWAARVVGFLRTVLEVDRSGLQDSPPARPCHRREGQDVCGPPPVCRHRLGAGTPAPRHGAAAVTPPHQETRDCPGCRRGRCNGRGCPRVLCG